MINSLIRDYKILSKLGAGGMGEVWLAQHQHLGNKVAIKALAPYLRERKGFDQRFLMEARSQASLRHPHIVAVKDFFEEKGCYYMVTEFCSGQNLHQLLSLKGYLPVEDALKITKPLLGALNYAHSRGVIHRDIKPANLMVTPEMQGMIMDFGLASMVGVRRVDSDRQVIGSPHYMAPEQIRNPNTTDHGIDTYAMGIVLYEMLTGRVPFDGPSTTAIWQRHLNERPVSPRTYNPKISMELSQIILKAIEKQPEDRFAGCGEFLEFIEYMEQEENAGPQTTPQDQALRFQGTPITHQDMPSSEAPPHPLQKATSNTNSKPTLKMDWQPNPVDRKHLDKLRANSHQPSIFTEFLKSLNMTGFLCITTVIATLIPNMIGLSMEEGIMGLPLLPDATKQIFFGGLGSTAGLLLSVGMFSTIFGCAWLWRAVAQQGFDSAKLFYGIGVLVAMVLAHYTLVVTGLLPLLCYLLVKMNVFSVYHNTSMGLYGSGFTEAFCNLLWIGTLVFIAGTAYIPARVYEQLKT